MAQSRSFFDEVKRELECSVCQEQFSETNEPKILKCLHTFCKSCLEAWLRQQGGGALNCPTCRQITECPSNNISSLPSNLFYKQMVDIVEAYSEQGHEDSLHCGNCDERKSLKCEESAGAHKEMKALSGRQVKDIGKFKPRDARDYARRANVCKKHNDEVRFYCEQCLIYICRDCAILDHRDHSIVSLDNGLQKKKAENENKMQEVQANSRLRSEKESLEKRRIRMNNSVEQATEEIHTRAERNIELIRQHEAIVSERLMKQKKTFEAAFSNTMTGLDETLVDERSAHLRNDNLHVLEKELQASFDGTDVAIHEYEMERKHQAGERLESRKKMFLENSKKLLAAKNRYLRQKENERVDEVIKSVQALQEDEQRKSEEARLRQQKLEQSHKEFTERAARKVKEVEELRLRMLRQKEQIKKEIQQLEVSCKSVKETAAKIQQTFQGCKFQSFLSPSVSEIQSEVNKVLKLSQNSLDSAHENGQATEMNVKIIQDCIDLIQSLFQKAKTLVHEANSKADRGEAERQAQEEAKAKEIEKRQQALKASKEKQSSQPSTSASQTSDSKGQSKAGISKELSSCISAAAWKEYSRLAACKSQIVESAEPLNTDKSLTQYKFDLHKAVTTPINAISDQSPSHLLDKIQRLTKLLSGQSVQVGGKQISISKHPAAKHFCKELLARKLVQQGSETVSSSHSSAFPIAAVITAIWSSFPDVGDLILAQFYDQCPFLVPFYIPRKAELSDAEYFASLGYHCSEGGIEEQDKFLKRMNGLVRLYAAVISFIPPSGQSSQHPYGLDNGWTWLSRMLNLEPRADYTATALYEFLAVAGHALMRKYKRQFGKLLNTLVLDYVPKIEKVTDKAQSGHVVRLKVFIEACIKDQKIPVPDGYLSPHWWRSSSF